MFCLHNCTVAHLAAKSGLTALCCGCKNHYWCKNTRWCGAAPWPRADIQELLPPNTQNKPAKVSTLPAGRQPRGLSSRLRSPQLASLLLSATDGEKKTQEYTELLQSLDTHCSDLPGSDQSTIALPGPVHCSPTQKKSLLSLLREKALCWHLTIQIR